MSSSNIIDDIATARTVVNWNSIMFPLGLVGYSMNICAFTRAALHFYPCIRSFMASIIAGYVVIFGILLMHLLQFWLQLNFTFFFNGNLQNSYISVFLHKVF